MTLWNNLVTEENARVDIYLDHQNIPTIGVGFNLRNADVLRLVLQQFGYTADALPNGNFDELRGELLLIFQEQNWQTNGGANRQAVQETLDQYREMMEPANRDAASETFAFNGTDRSAQAVAQMYPVFEAVRQDYVNQIVAQIRSRANVTAEQAQATWDGLAGNMQDALISLAYNGGATEMIGRNIAAALRDSHWGNAYYEIVFGSNGQSDFDRDGTDDGRAYGLQLRRFREGAEFIASLNIAELQQLHQTLVANGDNIQAYLDRVVHVGNNNTWQPLSQAGATDLYNRINGLAENIRDRLAAEGINVPAITFATSLTFGDAGDDDDNGDEGDDNGEQGEGENPGDDNGEPGEGEPEPEPEPIRPAEAMNLGTPPGGELDLWLNPDGSITEGGARPESGLLPTGVFETVLTGELIDGVPIITNTETGERSNVDGTPYIPPADDGDGDENPGDGDGGEPGTEPEPPVNAGQAVDLTAGMDIADSNRMWLNADGSVTIGGFKDAEGNLPTLSDWPVTVMERITGQVIDGDIFITNQDTGTRYRRVGDNWVPVDVDFSFDLPLLLKDTINQLFNTIDSAANPCDPLVFDINGSGVIETVGLEAGVLFDHSGDGIRHGTGWVAPGDAMLVLDVNGNGVIDNGSELFGDNHRIFLETAEERAARDGFEALSHYDLNNDKVIDANDAVFTELMLWHDVNQDGISQSEELNSLLDLGIANIQVDNQYFKHTATDHNGNLIDSQASFEWADGRVGRVWSLFFAANNFRNNFIDRIALTPRTEILPNIDGTGGLRNLREAATENDVLASLIEQFLEVDTPADKQILVDEILWQWHLSSATPTLYQTPWQETDHQYSVVKNEIAGKLSVVEAFNGSQITRLLEEINVGQYPNSELHHYFMPYQAFDSGSRDQQLQVNTILAINDAYFELHSQVYQLLSHHQRQLSTQSVLDTISYKLVADGSLEANFSQMESQLTERMSVDVNEGMEDLFTIISLHGKTLLSIGWDIGAFLQQMSNSVFSGADLLEFLPEKFLPLFSDSMFEHVLGDINIVLRDAQTAIVQGGDNADILFGGKDLSRLYGGLGDDILYSGEGNDTLEGGAGNDTYRFAIGWGQDTINSLNATVEDVDVIEFAHGILPADIVIFKNGNNLVLRRGVTDRIDVKDYFSDSNTSKKIAEVRFADGTVWNSDDLTMMVTTGTDKSDFLEGFKTDDVIHGGIGNDFINGADGNDTLFGEDGDDQINGDSNDDKLFGGAGNDALYGGDGHDVLNGGLGNDTLSGQTGNDEYHFARGWGADIIDNYDLSLGKTDAIVFDEGISPDDISIINENSSLVLLLKGSADMIRVNRYFEDDGDSAYKLEEIRFFDGTVWDIARVKAFLLQGAENDDYIAGYATDDVLHGEDGNDVLYGKSGSDVLIGGAGDDRLGGGDGNDLLKGDSGDDQLNGSAGDDVLDGGAGNDYLDGGEGNDTYLFGRGDGQDTIYNYDPADRDNPQSHDRLLFKDGVALEDIDFYRSGSDLVLRIIGSTDSITINDWFGRSWQSSDGSHKLQAIEFADGRRLDLAQVEIDVRTITGDDNDNTLYGFETDDVLIGAAGNDQLDGGAGSDEYRFARGWGQDTIHNHDTSTDKTDAIVFAEGITPTEILITRSGTDLIVMLNDSTDRIVVSGYFENDGTSDYKLEEIRFADGTVWNIEQVKTLAMQGTEGNDTLYGYATNDVLLGGAGADMLYGQDGDDELHGDLGKDELHGGKGKDLLFGGDGHDRLYGGDGDDVLNGGVGNDWLEGGSGVDTYVFQQGSGADIVFDQWDASIFRFLDTDSQHIVVRRKVDEVVHDGQVVNHVPLMDALLVNNLTGDTVTIKNFFGSFGSGRNFITDSQFQFADGVSWLGDELNARALLGTADNDTIQSIRQGGTITAEAGDDRIYGDVGNDIVYAGSGNDYVRAIKGNNELYGEDGNDHITGTGLLDGGAGDDVLEGKDADTLRGGDGNDTLIAHSDAWTQNSNMLEGGKGNDTLYGGFGDDTYIFNLGDGADVIIERRQGEAYSNVEASNDTLQFGEGIAADDLMFIRSGSDLLIRHSNGTDSITVQNWFAGSAHYQLKLLTFTDGRELTAEQIESQLVTFGTEGDDSLFGSAQVDVIYGEAGDDYIDGRAGDDTLHGGNGNDTITGGAGNDLLLGGGGDDKYVYNPQTGQDIIDNTGGGFDGVFFTNGIDASRLSFSQDGDDLVILVDGDETQSVRVLNHFLGGDAAISYVQPSGGYMLTAEQIAAAIAGGSEEPVDPTDPVDPVDPVDPTDPTDPVDPGQGGSITPGLGGNDELTGTTANDVLLGGAGDDVLTGLAGNDRLLGGTGSDSYIYHAGQDVITELGGTDKLIFSNGITFNQVASGLTKSGNDLILKVNGSNDNSVTLSNFFLGGEHLVETFEFETGGSISAAQIFGAFGLALPTADAPAVNAVQGTAGNDTLNGSAAADVLAGSHGNDTLNGGAGNDTLLGGRGNDTYVFSAGSGHDTIDNSGGGEDVLLFEGISFNQVASGLMKSGNDLVLNIGGGSDKVTLKNWFLGGDYVVPTIRFAAGGEISANQIFGAFGLSNPNPQGSLAYTELPDERAFGNVFVGSGAAESIIGSSDDDFIDGGNGNDSLSGGAGDDYLLGGRGNDTYLIDANDGDTVINNYDPTTGRLDVLRFAEGINPADVVAQRDGDNLLLAVAGRSVTVLHYFAEGGASAYRLDQIQFADGTVWDSSSVTQQLSAATSSMASSEPAFAAMGMMSVTDDMPAAEPFAGTTAKRAYQLNELERVFKLHSDRTAFERATNGKQQQDVIELARTDRLHSSGNSKHEHHVVELEKIDRLHSSELTVVEVAEQTAQLAGMDWQSMAQVEQPDTVVDSRYANLVDALNAFDPDDAEIGGNLVIQPKLEEFYY